MNVSVFAFAAASRSRRPVAQVRRTPRATPAALLEALERRDLFAAPVLDSSAHSTVFGQGITLTAILSPGQTGSVTFLDGATPLGYTDPDAVHKELFVPDIAVDGTYFVRVSPGFFFDATHAGYDLLVEVL